MLEKSKRSVDQGKVLDVFLTDLLKVFGCFHRKLIIAYSEFFWSVFSPNAGKYGLGKLRIRILFTQWIIVKSNAYEFPLLVIILPTVNKELK